MTNQTFYHFDRRDMLKDNIGLKRIFKNNRNQLNPFFMQLGLNPKAKDDFGNVLLLKVNDFVSNHHLSLGFIDELVARSNENENENEIVRKVLFELIFEETRRNSFKDLPSRMKSLFVVESIDHLEHWKKSLLGSGAVYKLTTIQMHSIHEADANWLESCNIDNLAKIRHFSENYWNGTKSLKPKNEWLVIGEFNCETL